MLWKISGLAEAGTNWSGWFHNTASKERMGKLQIYLLIKTVGKSHGWDGYRYLGSSSSGMSAARDWGSGAPTVKRLKKNKKNLQYKVPVHCFSQFLNVKSVLRCRPGKLHQTPCKIIFYKVPPHLSKTGSEPAWKKTAGSGSTQKRNADSQSWCVCYPLTYLTFIP